MLCATDFYLEAHRVIFDHLSKMLIESSRIDEVVLINELRRAVSWSRRAGWLPSQI